jgi:hypothetical protein
MSCVPKGRKKIEKDMKKNGLLIIIIIINIMNKNNKNKEKEGVRVRGESRHVSTLLKGLFS